MALVQAAGGTMNGTTWLDRTNYFETMPSHQLELALWLEADRMGTLLDALSQENLDNQRDVVKNEKRWSYDNRPYGDWFDEAAGAPLPAGAPVPPPDDRVDGGSGRGVARGREPRSSGPTTPPTTRCSRSSGDVDPAQVRRWVERYFGPIPAEPGDPAARRPDAAADRSGEERREVVEDRVPLPRDLLRLPGAGVRRHAASTRSSSPARSSPAARAAGSTGASSARSGSPRTSRSSRWGSSAGRRSCAGWATVRPGVGSERGRGGLSRGAGAARPRARHGRRAGAGEGADREPTSWARCSGSRSGPTGCRCTRRCSTTRSMINRAAAAVPGGDGEARSGPRPPRCFRPDNRVVLTYVPAAEAETRTTGRRAPRTRRRRHDARGDPGRAAGPRAAPPLRVPARSSGRSWPRPARDTFTCPAGRCVAAPARPPARRRDEPAESGGATVLAARAMTEGTERYPGVELIEAAERLGASLHAEAAWDAFLGRAGRAGAAPGGRPRAARGGGRAAHVPGGGGGATPRRASQRPAPGQGRPAPTRGARPSSATIYAPELAVLTAGRRRRGDVSRGLTSDALRTVHGSILAPDQAALVVGGDLDRDRRAEAGRAGVRLAGFRPGSASMAPRRFHAEARRRLRSAASALDGPSSGSIHRPGSVQTEMRIGHVGLPRRIPDFHAVGVMAAILGGLFNSRLQMNLREEKGYTYGVGAGFDMRRGRGPVRRAHGRPDGGHGAGHRRDPVRAAAGSARPR